MVLRKRSPLLRDFKIRFLEWVEGNITLKQKTKGYYENGWRLLEETDIVAMRVNAITEDDADRLTFPGGRSSPGHPVFPAEFKQGLFSQRQGSQRHLDYMLQLFAACAACRLDCDSVDDRCDVAGEPSGICILR